VLSYEIKFDGKYNFFESDVPAAEKSVMLRLIAEGNEVYEREIPLHFFIFHVPGEQNVTVVQVYLPYSERDREIRLLDGDEIILSIDLREELCNEDAKCDGFENYYSCPSDCAVNAEDGVCVTFSDGMCDPDCYYDRESVGKTLGGEDGDFLWLYFTIGLVLVFVIALTVKKRKII